MCKAELVGAEKVTRDLIRDEIVIMWQIRRLAHEMQELT
jgi:hypothetical protein